MGKFATKQARTLEVEFTLAPRNRAGESSRNSHRNNNNNNHADDEYDYNESMSIVQQSSRSIDAQNEQEFPSLAGTSSNVFTVRPSVSIRAKTFGPGGLARTKENFPALGGGSSDISPTHKTNNSSHKMPTAASALFKNGNTAANGANSGKVMIHLSNRPSTSNAAPPKKPEVNPKSAKDFPSLGRKADLESDFVPLVPANHNSVAAKHRSIVSQAYESAATGAPTKVGVVSRESTSSSSSKSQNANVPKFNSKDNFPALGNGSEPATPIPWMTTKKQPTESRKSKVAPPPLATTTKVETKPNPSTSKSDAKGNVKANNTKKDKPKSKVAEKKDESKVNERKDEPKSKGSKKTESKPLVKSDSDESECVPSQSVLSVVSAKHRSLINGYEPTMQANSSKLKFVKRESDSPIEKSSKHAVPAINSANNFPTLSSNGSKIRENNNNNMPISFIDIMKNAKSPTGDTDSSNQTTTSAPPGFDKSRKKPQPPPGFNSVTLNSVAKPTNNLTFTSSLGESYSILPAHHYLPPKNSAKRNKALFAHFQENEHPEAVEQFKEISKMFIQGSYHALPYYEHCKVTMKDKFDVIFPELLVLLPDISKQQVSDLISRNYLIHQPNQRNVSGTVFGAFATTSVKHQK